MVDEYVVVVRSDAEGAPPVVVVAFDDRDVDVFARAAAVAESDDPMATRVGSRKRMLASRTTTTTTMNRTASRQWAEP
jgi:hypothetical protein